MRRILSLTKDQQFIRKEQLDNCNAFSIFDSGSVVLRHITTDGFCKEVIFFLWFGIAYENFRYVPGSGPKRSIPLCAEVLNFSFFGVDNIIFLEEKLHILSMISNEPLPKHMCRSVIMDLLKKPPREKEEDDNQIASA